MRCPSSMSVALLLSALAGGAAGAYEIGDLVVADPGAAAIFAVDPSTGATETIASGGHLVGPRGVAVDPATLRVYVADPDAGAGGTGAVIRIDPTSYVPGNQTANQVIVAAGGNFEEPEDVFVERGGTLLVADSGGFGGVFRVDPATGVQTRVFGLAGANAVARDLDGFVYATSPLNGNELWRSDGGTGAPQLVSRGNFFSVIQDLAFEQDDTLLIADFGVAASLDGQVIRVDPDVIDTGNPGVNQSLLSDATNLVDTTGIATDAGRIFVADPEAEAGVGAIYEIAASDGAQTLVKAGPPLAMPWGIDVVRRGPQRGDVVVADGGGFRNLVLVDPQTGDQQLIRSFFPQAPVDVEIDDAGDLIVLVASAGSGAPRVARVDPISGRTRNVRVGSGLGTNDYSVPTRAVREGDHLFIGDSGVFIAPTFDKGAIFDLILSNGGQTIFTGGGGTRFRVLSIAIAPGGDFIVGVANNGLDSFDLLRVDRVNKARSLIQMDGDIARPEDIVVDSNGGFAYAACAIAGVDGTGALVRVNLSTGATQLLTATGELRLASGIAYDLNGDFFVAHTALLPPFTAEARLVRVPAGGGTPVLVSAGGLLTSPGGLAVFATPEPDEALSTLATLAVLMVLAERERAHRATQMRLGGRRSAARRPAN